VVDGRRLDRATQNIADLRKEFEKYKQDHQRLHEQHFNLWKEQGKLNEGVIQHIVESRGIHVEIISSDAPVPVHAGGPWDRGVSGGD